MPTLTDDEPLIQSKPTFFRDKTRIKWITMLARVLWVLSIGVIVFQVQYNDARLGVHLLWGVLLICAAVLSLIAKIMMHKCSLSHHALMVDKDTQQPLKKDT